jgi:hypothetical protein
LGFELSLPQVPTTPKEIGVFDDPTYIQTNKQTNNQTPDTPPETPSREMVFMKEAGGGRSGEQQKRDSSASSLNG